MSMLEGKNPSEQLAQELQDLDEKLRRQMEIFMSRIYSDMSDKEKLIFLRELKEETQEKAEAVLNGQIREQFRDRAIKNQKAVKRLFGLLKVEEEEEDKTDEEE